MDMIIEKTFRQNNIKTVGVIAPAGHADNKKIAANVELFNSWGVAVKIFGDTCGKNSSLPYLASEADSRIEAIHQAWQDKDIDLLFCVRGGFGSVHVLEHLNWDLLRARNLKVIGYSDITALHLAMLKNNAGTPVAAPMFANFANLTAHKYCAKYFAHLFDDEPLLLSTPPEYGKLNLIKDEDVSAMPVVANLSVLVSLCGTPHMPDFSQQILIIEDINEPEYKIDRCLTQLAQAGILGQLSGLIFGQFENCGDHEILHMLFRRCAAQVNGAVVSNFPFGHGAVICSVNQRKTMSIRGEKIFI